MHSSTYPLVLFQNEGMQLNGPPSKLLEIRRRTGRVDEIAASAEGAVPRVRRSTQVGGVRRQRGRRSPSRRRRHADGKRCAAPICGAPSGDGARDVPALPVRGRGERRSGSIRVHAAPAVENPAPGPGARTSPGDDAPTDVPARPIGARGHRRRGAERVNTAPAVEHVAAHSIRLQDDAAGGCRSPASRRSSSLRALRRTGGSHPNRRERTRSLRLNVSRFHARCPIRSSTCCGPPAVRSRTGGCLPIRRGRIRRRPWRPAPRLARCPTPARRRWRRPPAPYRRDGRHPTRPGRIRRFLRH